MDYKYPALISSLLAFLPAVAAHGDETTHMMHGMSHMWGYNTGMGFFGPFIMLIVWGLALYGLYQLIKNLSEQGEN